MSPTCGCEMSGVSASRSRSRLLEHAADDLAVGKQSKRRERRRAAQRVAGIGVAVKEVAVLIVPAEKCVVNLIGCQRRGNRQISAGQTLRDAQQIRSHSLLLTREHRAGAAEAGCHFIENQQRAMLAARRGGPRKKSLGQRQHSRGRLHARFEDHGADPPVGASEGLLQLVGAIDRAIRRRFADRTPIAVRRRRLQRGKQDRLEDVMEQLNAADRRSAKRVAMIGVVEAEIDGVAAPPLSLASAVGIERRSSAPTRRRSRRCRRRTHD